MSLDSFIELYRSEYLNLGECYNKIWWNVSNIYAKGLRIFDYDEGKQVIWGFLMSLFNFNFEDHRKNSENFNSRPIKAHEKFPTSGTKINFKETVITTNLDYGWKILGISLR